MRSEHRNPKDGTTGRTVSLRKRDELLDERRLGKTNMIVKRLGYGAMELRGPRIWNGRAISEKVVEHLLNLVLDSGINFIDTANVYGDSETLIGKYVSHRRSCFILATKCGWVVDPLNSKSDITPHVWTKKSLCRSIDQSLRRMRTEYIDLIQLHNPTPEECEHGDLLSALEDMRDHGKVRWLGISTKIPDIINFLELDAFQTFQVPYSALRRDHEDYLTEIAKRDVGTIVRGGVAQGAPGTGHGFVENWQKFEAARLDELRDENDSRTAFLLRFALSHDAINVIIVGTAETEHLQENVEAASRGPLPKNVYREALMRLDAVGLKPVPHELKRPASWKETGH
jgi:aryl-alcohol dehydrogenase-like predicted oxidoreductase